MIWQVSHFPCQDWTSPFLVGALKHQNSKFRPHNGRKPINQELPEWKIFAFHYDTRMAKWHVMGRAIHMPLTSFMPLASFMRKLLIRLHAFQQFKTVKCHKAFTLNLAYRIRQDLWTINNTPPPKKNKTHSKIATCREVLNPQIQKMIFFAQPPHQKVCLIGLKLNIIPKHKKVSKNQHNINHFNKNILKNWPTKRTKKPLPKNTSLRTKSFQKTPGHAAGWKDGQLSWKKPFTETQRYIPWLFCLSIALADSFEVPSEKHCLQLNCNNQIDHLKQS